MTSVAGNMKYFARRFLLQGIIITKFPILLVPVLRHVIIRPTGDMFHMWVLALELIATSFVLNQSVLEMILP